MKIIRVALLLILGLTFVGFIGWRYRQSKIVLLDPTTDLLQPTSLEITDLESSQPKVVYGFLPFWLTKEYRLHPALTHLAYFSLTIDADGQIETGDRGVEPGYRFFQSQEFSQLLVSNKQQRVNSEVVLAQFDNQEIESFLSNPSATKRFQTTVESLLHSHPISGINIDIEYSGSQSAELRPLFTELIQSLDQMLEQKFPETKLSVDVYPSAIDQTNIWDIEAIAPHVDYLIVMAYDFHRANSIISGPVAPLLSTQQREEDKNILYYMSKYVKVMDSSKILLGVPFYGYEWQTSETGVRAPTFPKSGLTASFKRIQSIVQNQETQDLKLIWEEDTLSPFITFQDDDRTKVISYESPLSLAYKLDLVKQAELGGIAIWALGYEGDQLDLWQVIENRFGQN